MAEASGGMMTAAALPQIKIRPQDGPQYRAMSCGADILIFGGEAGGGKSYQLLMEPVRHIRNPNFNAVAFRRVRPQITNPGGLWDDSRKVYGPSGARSFESSLEWVFPSGATVKMAGLQYEDDVKEWDGSQIALLLFDQLESFTEHQFFYMLSRNRSVSGVRPYVRASCNPQPGWLADFLAWWIDEDGWPIPERDGVLRWMVRIEEKVCWGSSWQELYEQFPEAVLPPHASPQDEPHRIIPKSVTFIASSVYDNKILLKTNPEYLSNLMALPRVERLRLLGQEGRRGGNWKVRPLLGMMFSYDDFKLVEQVPDPTQFSALVRYWDKAGSEHKTELEAKRAHTAGVLMGRVGTDPKSARFYVLDVVRGQWKAHEREQVILQTAQLDAQRWGKNKVLVWHEQEPGSGGKDSADATTTNLTNHGFAAYSERVTGSKVERAMPWSASCQAGNVFVLKAHWSKGYIDEHVAFAPTSLVKDQVDASSAGHAKLAAAVPWRTSRAAH